MATSTKTICFLCEKIKVTYLCPGCSKCFCFDQLQNNHDQLRQQLNDFRSDPTKHPWLEQIDQWEKDSINKIQQQAQLCRIQFIDYSNSCLQQIEDKLSHLATKLREIHQENAFNEIDLDHFKRTFEKLEKQLNQPANVSTEQQPTSFINKISLLLPSGKTQWRLSSSMKRSNSLKNHHSFSL